MDYWEELFEEQLDDDLKKLNNFSYVDGFDLIYDALLNLRGKAANGSLKRIRFLLLKRRRMGCPIFHYCIFLL